MRSHLLKFMVCLLLIVATFAVYWQVRNYDFVNYDDNQYVTENYYVQAGLTWKGVIWAFTTNHASNWHPLTWLSHMLDCELYGLNPGRHHLTSLILHVVNTLLLFLVLERITGGLWQSAFVAALFALHPLHVESVAWIAERKDVLSTFFLMLTMWAYVRYVQAPNSWRYLLALLAFALGLMSKPMLVTLPFVMLLIDYWPLARFQCGSPPTNDIENRRSCPMGTKESTLHLVAEKLPFLALALIASYVTLFAQRHTGAVMSFESLPLEIRIANTLVSYIGYIGKTIWPHKLVVLYPLSQTIPMWKALGAGLLLASISAVVIRTRQRFPYLAVGWLWYLGTLVPVIGLVHVGVQSMADRYTYITLVGLFIMITWGFSDSIRGYRHQRPLLAVLTGTVILALATSTWFQVQYWENSIKLFRHTLEVTTNNWVAHNNLGASLDEQGNTDEAIGHYEEALTIKPEYPEAHNNLGFAFLRAGRLEKAFSHLSEALHLKPNYPEALNNLGLVLARQRKLEEAIAHFSMALQAKPDFPQALNNLGLAFAQMGRLKEAIDHFSKALSVKPAYLEARYNLGFILANLGKLDEAVVHFSQILHMKPDSAKAHYSMGLAMARQGRLQEAIMHYSQALQLKPGYAEAHSNMGLTLAELGKSEEAIHHFSHALRVKPDLPEAHNNMAAVLARQGKLQKAISHYSKALQIDPKYARAHNNLGLALVELGRFEEAIIHYSEALSIKPEFAEAQQNLKLAQEHLEVTLSGTPKTGD